MWYFILSIFVFLGLGFSQEISVESNRLFIEGDWAGTIHAARASLVMGQTNKEMYGRFVANTLVIHQNSQIYRVDFNPVSTELVLK